MTTDITWEEFCELYYETAKKYASVHLQKQKDKLGKLDKRVDQQYVMDAAALAALEKTYAHFDMSRGTKITTYLSTIVHNEIVDVLTKESKAAAMKSDIEDMKTAVRAISDDPSGDSLDKLVPKLEEAIARLSPSDQVILGYYLEDKSSYIAKSSETLNISEAYVSVRRNRIMKLLPKLMGMTRDDYLLQNYKADIQFMGKNIVTHTSFREPVPNPILPSLDLEKMAVRLAGLLAEDQE